MVTADGRVKIVDFGLAKTPEVEPALVGGPTATQTAAGLIMGTVPYMSPEQARGSPADFRSDQFALGVMLYEMTTATHPFKRETAVQTLSAIIAEEPPDPRRVAPSLPVPVRWLIRRLLAKEPRERFAHTADLAAELRTIRGYLSEATVATVPVTTCAIAKMADAGCWRRAGRGRTAPRRGAHAAAGDRRVRQVHAVRHRCRLSERARVVAGRQADRLPGRSRRRGPDLHAHAGSATRTQITKSRFDCYISAWSADGNIYYHSPRADTDGLVQVSPVPGARPETVIEDASRSAIPPSGKTVYFLRDRGDGMATTLWSKTLPDGKEERYARGALANGLVPAGICVSPRTGHTCCCGWVERRRPNLGFWEIALPDGEPRAVMPGVSRAGSRRRSSAGCPTTGTCWSTRSDGSTPGTHCGSSIRRTRRPPVRRRGRARTR